MRTLTDELNRQPDKVKRAYLRLDTEQKIQVVIAFERHRKGCEGLGVHIDPSFVQEAVTDARKGFLESV